MSAADACGEVVGPSTKVSLQSMASGVSCARYDDADAREGRKKRHQQEWNKICVTKAQSFSILPIMTTATTAPSGPAKRSVATCWNQRKRRHRLKGLCVQSFFVSLSGSVGTRSVAICAPVARQQMQEGITS